MKGKFLQRDLNKIEVWNKSKVLCADKKCEQVICFDPRVKDCANPVVLGDSSSIQIYIRKRVADMRDFLGLPPATENYVTLNRTDIITTVRTIKKEANGNEIVDEHTETKKGNPEYTRSCEACRKEAIQAIRESNCLTNECHQSEEQ